MARLLLALLVSALGAASAQAENYTDWWWNPDQSGHGINVGQQGSKVLATWFTYDEQGADTWLVMGGELSGNVFEADLNKTTGTPLGTPYNPALLTEVTVGHATLTFLDPFNATFAWSVNGKSGTKSGTVALVRQSYALLQPVAGTYFAATSILATGCGLSGGQFGWTNRFDIVDLPANPTSFSDVQVTPEDATITYTGSLEHAGRWLRSAGNYHGAGGVATGLGGGAYAMSVLPIDNAVFIDATLTATTPAGCARALHAVAVQ
jgi:hypothetical protein